jgi:hypothetical protein
MVVCIILNVQQSQSSKVHGRISSHGCSHHYFWELQVVADATALFWPPAIPISRFAVQCMFYFISLISLEVHFTRRVSELFVASNLYCNMWELLTVSNSEV